MTDSIARIKTDAEAVATEHAEWQRLREHLRCSIIAADRDHGGPGVNEIIRAATTGKAMSKQKVVDAIQAGRLEREVTSLLAAAGLQAGDGDRVLVARRVDTVLICPIGDEDRWTDEESVRAEAEQALATATRVLEAAGLVVRHSGGEYWAVTRDGTRKARDLL